MSPAYAPEVRAERDRLLLQLAGEGRSLNQIAAALGVTRQAVHQRLAQLGHSIKDFPRAPRPPKPPTPPRATVPCSYCGAPVVPTRRETRYGLHSCPSPACRDRYRREVKRRRYLERRWLPGVPG